MHIVWVQHWALVKQRYHPYTLIDFPNSASSPIEIMIQFGNQLMLSIDRMQHISDTSLPNKLSLIFPLSFVISRYSIIYNLWEFKYFVTLTFQRLLLKFIPSLYRILSLLSSYFISSIFVSCVVLWSSVIKPQLHYKACLLRFWLPFATTLLSM